MKFLDPIKKAFRWLKTKYVSVPWYLQWLALMIIVSPAIAIFLVTWFCLEPQFPERSFTRWIIAVAPSFLMILGIILGMSFWGDPDVKDR